MAEQVTDAVGSDLTAGDYAVVGNDATAAPSLGRTYDFVMESDAFEGRFGRGAAGLVQFSRIEIREPNFNPFLGIGRLTNAKAVSVTDVSDDSEKLRRVDSAVAPRMGRRGRERWHRTG